MENIHLMSLEGIDIRKIWHNEEWYFNVVDIIAILTDSENPRNYWAQTKKRLAEKEGAVQSVTNCHRLKFKGTDGRFRSMDAANTEGVLRIVMSVPSPKAEPLKLWLAQMGKQAIDETENPELGFERMVAIYKAKGYSDEWIKNRLQDIETRKLLTDEWQQRGVKKGQEYSVLTATIAKGTFGLIPSEHKKLKGLEKPSQELRDHMTPLELIFSALGEELTRKETIKNDAQGFDENKTAAHKGGNMAGKARLLIEAEQGEKVVSKENFLKPLADDKNALNE